MSAAGGAAAREVAGAAAGPPAPGGAPARAQEGGTASMLKNILRMFLLTQAIQLGVKYFMGNKNGASPAASNSSAQVKTTPAANQGNVTAQPGIVPLWPQGTAFNIHLYVSEDSDGRVNIFESTLPHTTLTGLTLGDWKWEQEWNTQVVLPKVSRFPPH